MLKYHINARSIADNRGSLLRLNLDITNTEGHIYIELIRLALDMHFIAIHIRLVITLVETLLSKL